MTGDVIHPTFHHVTLKTTRLQEMIDFYVTSSAPRSSIRTGSERG
jgi:catechol 2,3-dioxygenase-like lactoylglutathione lyase family enzyme